MTQYQKLFTSHFIDVILSDLTHGKSINLYGGNAFPYRKKDERENKRIIVNDLPELIIPEENGGKFEYENAVKLFGAYKNLNRTQATDTRVWIYMSHAQYWRYMRARWPLPTNVSEDKLITHILDHWFMQSSKSISRHGIASLWWGAFITYDKDRENPFELTEEFFSKQDYKRVILEENICMHKPLVHAILEYVIENKEIFEKYWKERIRFLIRKLNFISSYKLLSSLSKTSIKNIIDEFKNDLALIEPEKAMPEVKEE